MVRMDQRGFAVIPAILVVAAVASTAVAVPVVVDKIDVGPDSPFYALERLGEQIQGLSVSALVTERVAEYQQVAAQGQATQFSSLLADISDGLKSPSGDEEVIPPPQDVSVAPAPEIPVSVEVPSDITSAPSTGVPAQPSVPVEEEEPLPEHSKYLQGKGAVYAYGNGSAELAGNGIIHVSTAVGGTVTIYGGAKYNAYGEGTKENLENGVRLTGYGLVNIVGEEIVVTVEGQSIVLMAAGVGSVKLVGQGFYKVLHLNVGQWAPSSA